MSTPVTIGQPERIPGHAGTEPGGRPGGAYARRLARSPALRLAGRRLLIAVPVLWGVTFLTFVVENALPGDAAQALLGANATPAEIRAESIKLHLNQPLLIRYWDWLWAALHGNLGNSLYSGQPVGPIVAQRLPVTIDLVAYALVVTLVISIPLAILCARKPGGITDRTIMALCMAGLSIAPIVLALLLLQVFSGWLHNLLPALASGTGNDPRDLTMPALTLALPLAAFYTRFLRADLIEQMQSEDYTVTALAKGLSRWRVLTRHALRNSFIGLLTVIGLNLATLIGVTVIAENIFGLAGIGNELLQAIQHRDVPLLEGIVLVFAGFVVLVNLATDLLYSVLDPRIRHGRSRS
ncbi:MAG TPA: ABC transporter permease [Streptosporangiaceae bacterium]|nr:ABC transporter permease [Streptosporangiaceae bacterium]